jgi:MtrB/PioB family decaheme-associated outer membrane protein
VAVGRMTQDEAFLPPTSNPTLAAAAEAALPARSLDGHADTFNSSIRLTATPAAGLRLNAVVARNQRDNQTTSRLYPAVATDLFIGPEARRAPAFSFKQNRIKASADYRIGAGSAVSAGVDRDENIRSWQDVVATRETTVWARGSISPVEPLALSLKLSTADRGHSPYGRATWVTSLQNPLLRKYNLTDRERKTAALRADVTVSETLSVGLYADLSRDNYPETSLGLTLARSLSGGVDVAWTMSEDTQFHAYAQNERTRSMQAGSEAFAAPDWWSRSHDTAHVLGLGVKHSALKGQLVLGGDLSVVRSRASTSLTTVVGAAPYPTATQQRDSLRLHATWKLKEDLSVVGRYGFERQAQADWRLDGLQPDTLQNLLALGETPANYRVNVFSVALRYRY